MIDVSVIIPAYNAGRFIREAIESVLGQTVSVAEIIVVDDGSTDETAEIAKSFPSVTYLHQPNQGTAAAVNAGIMVAKGTHFAFLDADDLWLTAKIKRQLEFFESEKQAGMVFTFLENFICDSVSDATRIRLDVNTAPVPGVQKSTLMIERNIFFKVGLFLPSSRIDLLDWYARAKEADVPQHMINEVLVRRRVHDHNQSIKDKTHAKDFPGIIKSILDRRRK